MTIKPELRIYVILLFQQNKYHISDTQNQKWKLCFPSKSNRHVEFHAWFGF